MPVYEYECQRCQARFERLQKFSDPPLKTCPECGGEVQRLIHPAGIVFKGSGWYATDNRIKPIFPDEAAERKSDKKIAAPETSSTTPKSASTQKTD